MRSTRALTGPFSSLLSSFLLAGVAAASIVACSSSSSSGNPAASSGSSGTGGDDSGVSADTGNGGNQDSGSDSATPPADAGADVDKAAQCASTFGSELVTGFGRLDGTVLAVVPPADNACALPNSDHVVLQVTMHGAAYRMVINVKSDQAGDPRVQMKEVDAALLGGDWSEGWHVPASLDYPTMLNAHDKDFTPYDMGPLAQRIADFITVGEKISVFSTNNSPTYKDSTHLIHRNGNNQDGAIVVGAAGPSPKYLIFHFSEQTF